MKKIGFVGVYDKIDLILCIAKVLAEANLKILVVDATDAQKSKYIVPAINPTKSYITEYEGIDVAIGFESFENIKQYMGLEQNENLEYDIIMIDTDNYNGVVNFNIASSEKIYYVSSFDAYSLKKGIEILNDIQIPIHMSKIFYSKEMLKEEQEYFDYLSLGVKIEWDEDILYFLLDNGDQPAISENQRIQRIKLRNLSETYRDNVVYLVDHIENSLGERKIKNIVKNL